MKETRRIGSLEVSLVGLGCNNFGGRLDADATAKVVYAALDAGINFFDTADIYGGTKSEEFIGQALGSRRDEVVLATKFGIKLDDARPGGASAAYIKQAAEDSLRRLRTDRIDLYQLHAPDPHTPMEETMGALNELVQAGKVREIGCSNFSVEQLRTAEAAARPGAARYVSVQNHYSLFHRAAEQDVLPECERTGIAFLPYFPLANGLLTGKYRKGQPFPEGTRIQAEGRNAGLLSEENLDKVEALIAFAEARNHTLLELAFGWLLAHPSIASVIAGATSVQQAQNNAAAAGWKLTSEEVAAINQIVS
ncbi:MAG TPA: aldo/keto reductase [Chthonomonadaceae bacterium]|nr:aldo/keto reductase [Chthonomonadaceae bacterium]